MMGGGGQPINPYAANQASYAALMGAYGQAQAQSLQASAARNPYSAAGVCALTRPYLDFFIFLFS